MDLRFVDYSKKGISSYTPNELAVLKRKYNFVDYYELVVGTLFSQRLKDLGIVYYPDKLIQVFVSCMKKQVATLPIKSKLKKEMSEDLYNGCFILSKRCDRSICEKTFEYLENLRMIKYSKNKTTLSITPFNKLSPEALKQLNSVEMKYLMATNKFRNMVFDCCEDILLDKKKCVHSFKTDKTDKYDGMTDEEFAKFYSGIQETIAEYLKPKKKSTAEEKQKQIFVELPQEENFDSEEKLTTNQEVDS